MKKRCALILSGFLRDEANLDNLRIFLENNPEYIIDLYIYTYDTRGTKTKIVENNQDNTPVTLETFSPLNSHIKSIHIKSYDETQKYINNFIEEKNLTRIIKNKEAINWIKKYKVKTSLHWQINILLSQFYMNWQNIQEIKKSNEKYDIVIKSRFDINHHHLRKISSNIKKNSFIGYMHRWTSKTHRSITRSVNRRKVFDTRTKADSFPALVDLYFILHFDSLSCLENAYDINLVPERYKDDYWVKSYHVSSELQLSIGLFIECDSLNKIHVKHRAHIRDWMNRESKW